MKTFRAVMWNEMRVLWRRRSFWILQAVLFLPAVVVIVISLFDPILGQVFYGQGIPGLGLVPLLYLVMPILAGPAILRDLESIGELLWSSPLDPLVHHTGIFTGLWLGLLPGTLLQLGSWRLAGIFVPTPPPLFTWPYTLGLYLLTNTLGISLVFLAATLTRRMLPLLLGWTALWGFVFFKVDFMEGLNEAYFPMATLAFWNVFFHNLALSPTLRLGLSQRLVLSMLVWFLGLALAAFALTGLLGWLFDRRRTLRNLVVWGALSAVGLVLLAGGYALNAAAAAAAAPPVSPLDPQIDRWQVVEQTTRVEVNARNGELSGTATLHLEPDEDLEEPRLVLRLNPGLEVARAIAGGNKPLTWERQGDSVIFALPAPAEGALWLELDWEGELQISFLSYDLPWMWADGPEDLSYVYAPLPVRGLILPHVGYLLRDGDWMPWPWVTSPHQALVGMVSIALNGAQAIAPAPLRDGEVVLDAPLPEALLVYHDAAPAEAGNMQIIATPRLNAPAMQQVYLFVSAVQQASEMLGETPPGRLVMLPYLDRIIWAGDLLLLPDGSGKHISSHLSWMQGLFWVQDGLPGAENPAGLERTTLAALLRQWMLDRAPAPELEYHPFLMGNDGWLNSVILGAATREKWDEQGGRWAQHPEAMDVYTWWSPRRNTALEPIGKLSALAFWLATETSNPDLFLDDLALVEKLDAPGAVIGGNETHRLASARSWPEVMYSDAGRAEVQALHEWAQEVGQPRANELVIAALLQNQPLVAEELWQVLATESGVALMEVQP